ncbi:GapR family DNA-binding domain-containing protein [Ensifer adhaerens]|uniref:GapR family DNA-binding domain-containing protein n=1 Tax=Ensifer adhaerens TaxID=106592 RepID=UPI00384DADEE
MSADKQLKAYIDRVLRLKEEQDTLGDDIREVYAEAKSEGYDKTIMGKLVAHLRKVAKSGQDAVSEQEMNFDTYLQAYHRASGTAVATHTHEKNSERFDPLTGEFLDDNVDPKLAHTIVTGLQTETGRAALTTAIDIMIAREEAEEDPVANVVEGATSTTAAASSDPASRADDESERQHSSTVGVADDCRTGGKEQSDASAAPVGDAGAYAPGIPALSEIANEGGATETIQKVGQGAGNSHLIEPTGPVAERATDSPDTATKSLGDGGGSTVEPNGTATAGTAVTAGETATEFDGIRYEASPPRPMKSLPYAACFPELSHAHYQQLSDSIANNGVREPIVRMGDVIVDGWSRYNISRSLGIEYPVVSYLGNDVLLDVIAWQREARQFTAVQERQIASRLAKEVPHRAADIMAAFSLTEEREMA